MSKRALAYLFMLVVPSLSFAGESDSSQMFFEVGGSYLKSFYKSSTTHAESRTATHPNGFTTNPNDYYPGSFFGGYFGLSFYTHQWLINTRYSVFKSQTKENSTAKTTVELAPARLDLTVDHVWGDINDLSYGAGLGVVADGLNHGEFRLSAGNADLGGNPDGESLGGRFRFDPVVEAFVMKRFSQSVSVKAIVGYQININSSHTNGDFYGNLGLNYALPI